MGFYDKLWHQTLRRPYNLAYTEQGQGKPVVLLHGLGASKAIWRPLANLLPSDKWHVITPDLLGFGGSPRPDWNTYDINEHSRMVVAFLKRQQIITPITLVGHSMGCLVAAHIAATKPDLIKRLVLYEPPLLDEIPEFPEYTRRSTRYKAFFEYIASHPQLAYLEGRLLWRVARRISGLEMDENSWMPFERSLRNTILSQHIYGELRTMPLPTDIVYGRLDFIVIRQGVKDLFKHNKNITLHLVTDVHGISPRSAKYLAALLDKTIEHRPRRLTLPGAKPPSVRKRRNQQISR